MVAIGLMTGALLSLAQLFVISMRTNGSSRNATYAAVLAQQKVEELRSLTWGFDVQGLPLSDTTTNSAVDPLEPNDGTGLSPSPASALQEDTPGYVDYIDAFGKKLGGGGRPIPGTAYIRRWSVEPLSSDPDDTLIIQVLVTRPGSRPQPTRFVARGPDEARLVTVKTRTAR